MHDFLQQGEPDKKKKKKSRKAQNIHTKPQLIFHEGHGNFLRDIIREDC